MVFIRRNSDQPDEIFIACHLMKFIKAGDVHQDVILQRGDVLLYPAPQTLADPAKLRAFLLNPQRLSSKRRRANSE